MPDTLFKATMFLEGKEHGWTESYWTLWPTNDYLDVMANLKTLAKARAALLGKECFIKALRVSQETVKGDSYLLYVNYNGDLQQPAAEPDAAVLFRIRNQDFSRAHNSFLRGFWDVVETNNGEYLSAMPAWAAVMKDFKAYFTGPKALWGWYGVDAPVKADLLNYAVDVEQRITFTFKANLFPAPLIGKRTVVRLAGINGKSNLNGQQVVDVLSQTSAITFAPIANVPYQFGGRGTWSGKVFIKSWSAVDERVTTRKVGAPLLESHGRAKARPRT